MKREKKVIEWGNIGFLFIKYGVWALLEEGPINDDQNIENGGENAEEGCSRR
ncbi:MAG: hypothetical protein QW765_03025 [Fervidicoccaceae archaeon]